MGLSHETLDRWQEYADEDVLDLIEVEDMKEAIRVLRALLAPPVSPGTNSFQLFKSAFENVKLISEEQKEHKS